MIKKNVFLPLLLLSLIFFPGCDLIEDVFQAGIWFAIIAILIIGGLLYLIFSIRSKPKAKPKVVGEKVRTDDSGSTHPGAR